jgi:Domain of unknown function (DUF6766)
VGQWIRQRSLGILFVSLFLASWIVQLFFEWHVYVNEQREHGGKPSFWSAGFWDEFGQSTFENWQSEFLQLAAFTIATAYLVYAGSSESPDSEERIEAKLDALLEQSGVDPKDIEKTLAPKHQKRT